MACGFDASPARGHQVAQSSLIAFASPVARHAFGVRFARRMPEKENRCR
jgi:hypothetical protein